MSDNSFSIKDWIKAKADVYDQQEVYAAEIKPLVDQVYALCIKHNIPCHFIAAITDDDERTGLTTMGVYPSANRCPTPILLARETENATDTNGFRAILGATALKLLSDQDVDLTSAASVH